MAKQRNSPRPTVTTLPDFGKVPPQANDMEEAVLGAVMLEKEAVITILDILKPESFYREAHQKIFQSYIRSFIKGVSRWISILLLKNSGLIMNLTV